MRKGEEYSEIRDNSVAIKRCIFCVWNGTNSRIAPENQ